MYQSNPFYQNILTCKSKGDIPVIGEIKVFSPSEGDLLRGRNIEDIARIYLNNGITCLSVVTGKWYKGSMDLLLKLRENFDCPILRKDFITNKYQIKSSKEAGANAILLTRKLLRKEHLKELAEYAFSIDVMPFIEIADENEAAELEIVPGSILAVNNKNIQVKETDKGGIEKSMRLLKKIQKHPASFYVSASGIDSAADIKKLAEEGFDAFLIGTSLLKSDDMNKKIQTYIHI